MIAIRQSIHIKRSHHKVFASLTDLRSWQEWSSNRTGRELFPIKTVKVGLRLHHSLKKGWKPIVARLEVTDWLPDWFFGRFHRGLQGEFVLVPIESGTHLTARFEMDADGINAILYKLFLTQWIKQDLHRFKEWMERNG